MKEQRGFIKWAKAHKKELAIAGICLATLIATILCYKNKDVLKTLWTTVKKRIDSPAKAPVKAVVAHTPKPLPVNPVIEPAQPIIQVIQPVSEIAPTVARHATMVPFEVDPHIRDLHPGWHASPEKIATAAAHSCLLSPTIYALFGCTFRHDSDNNPSDSGRYLPRIFVSIRQ